MILSRAPNEKYEISVISELRQSLSIPKVQRVVKPDRVDKIYQSVKNEYLEGKEFRVLGTFIVAEHDTSEGTKKYLIDGQHRFLAYSRLLDEFKYDTKIVVNSVKVSSESDLRNVFYLVNDTVPVAKIPESLNLEAHKNIVAYFVARYAKCFSNSPTGRSQRPKVHTTAFEEFVVEVLKKYPEDALDKLIYLNEHLKTLNVNVFKQPRDTLKKIDEFREKAEKSGGLFFGLFPDLNDLMKILESSHLKNEQKASATASTASTTASTTAGDFYALFFDDWDIESGVKTK